MKRILLIDDDTTTHVVAKNVVQEQFELVSCYSLQEARSALQFYDPPALMIIDRGLPDGDGLSLCVDAKADPRLASIPIIFLSSHTSETDKVSGLFAGADDYICKPVSPLELKARIWARLRSPTNRLVLGKISVDLATHRVHLDSETGSREIELTRIEFKLLSTLINSPDRVFSRDTLLTEVWGQNASLSDRVVDTHISHLRKKIDGSGLVIEGLRGEGYRLRSPTASSQAA